MRLTRSVTNIENKIAAKGNVVSDVAEEEIVHRQNAEVVKELPWAFLFKKKMITRTLTAMFLCFTMNVLVYTVISWTPTILKTNGFDPFICPLRSPLLCSSAFLLALASYLLR